MTRVGKSYAKEAVRARTGRDPRDILRELYVDRRYSQQEVADALAKTGVAVSRELVAKWLAEYGITQGDRPPAEVPL